MTLTRERDLWNRLNDAIDWWHKTRNPRDQARFHAMFDQWQAEKRAATRRHIAHIYRDDRYLQPGDKP